MPRPAPSRVAAALNYLERLKNQAAEFGGGVVENLADRARSAGELAYEALATDPNMGRMTTAEYAQAADRPTPRLDEVARQVGALGRAIVTQPVETGKAIVQGEVERAREAMSSPRAAGQYAGSFIDPMRIAAALRKTAPILELDVYHGTRHRFPATKANPLGEFDANAIGTGAGSQSKGHGIYFAENLETAKRYQPSELIAEAKLEKLYKQAFKNQDENALDVINSVRLNSTIDELRQQYPRQKKLIDQIARIEKAKGSLYKSDLPDEMIARMLDWDKPLSEQPTAVREALRELADLSDEKSNARLLLSGNNDPKTSALFRAIGDALPGTDQTATIPGNAELSMELAKRGIPGIKYLDAGSRGQGGSGTRNFVVFPGEEKKVKILERK